MEAQHQMLRTNEAQSNVQPKKHHVHLNQTPAEPPASSSPSHEFSFTISLHPPAAAKSHDSKIKPSPPPFASAIDLSPADDIFFHGHLLPLHLLHHLPVSPRSSTNSPDSFTLPIKELLNNNNNNNNNNNGDESRHVAEGKERGKSKSFSLLGIWKKEREDGGGHNNDHHNNQQTEKRQSRFELIKRYVRFVKAFLSPRGRRRRSSDEFLRQQPYSYSGNLRVRKRESVMMGRRGEFSAPASMRTSPGNSGLLVASGAATPTAGKIDSTMEELQAAIQAAIAHCKKSHAVEDKSKLQP